MRVCSKCGSELKKLSDGTGYSCQSCRIKYKTQQNANKDSSRDYPHFIAWLIVSIVSFLIGNIICGTIAIIFVILGNKDHKDGYKPDAVKKYQVVKICMIISIIKTMLLIMITIIFFIGTVKQEQRYIDEINKLYPNTTTEHNSADDFDRVLELTNKQTENKFSSEYEKKYSAYDQKIVTGADIFDAISNCKDDEICIRVQNLPRVDRSIAESMAEHNVLCEGTAYIFTDDDYEKLIKYATNPENPNYINPDCNYYGYLSRDKYNNGVTSINFVKLL